MTRMKLWWHLLWRKNRVAHRHITHHRLDKSVREGGGWVTAHYCSCGYLGGAP